MGRPEREVYIRTFMFVVMRFFYKISVKFTKCMFDVVRFRSCSRASVVFIRSSLFGQVNNPRLVGTTKIYVMLTVDIKSFYW